MSKKIRIRGSIQVDVSFSYVVTFFKFSEVSQKYYLKCLLDIRLFISLFLIILLLIIFYLFIFLLRLLSKVLWMTISSLFILT